LGYGLAVFAVQVGVDFTVSKDEMSFQEILELTYIPGPVIPDTRFQQTLRQRLYRTGVSLSIFLQKVFA